MKLKLTVLRRLALACVTFTMFVPVLSQAHSWHKRYQKEVIGYYISWGIYGRAYTVKSIVDSGSADKLTIINYAFSNVAPDSTGQIVCQLGDAWADFQTPWTAESSVSGEAVTWPNPVLGNFQQLMALKELYPKLRVMISLGGWTFSKHFSDAALTPESRAILAKSCIDLYIKGDLPDPGWGGMGGPGAAAGLFDGIDIDWEWPASEGHPDNIIRPEDEQNYTLLLAEFRKQLNEINPELLLTIAGPTDSKKHNKFEFKKLQHIVDFINVLSYDFHGAWDLATNHHANLFRPWIKDTTGLPEDAGDYSVHRVTSEYLRAGLPGRQLAIGVPFYSRGWTGVNDANNGLFQVATDPAPGTYEAGVIDFKVADKLTDEGFTRYLDRRANSAWLFNGETFWTFDDPKTTCHKSLYARLRGLRGVMFWELSGDDEQASLLTAIDGCLNRSWWKF